MVDGEKSVVDSAEGAPRCPGQPRPPTIPAGRAREVMIDSATDFERVRQERDLYLGLLGLNDREHPGPFLEEALGLIVRILGAGQGVSRGLRSERGSHVVASRRVARTSRSSSFASIVSRGIIAGGAGAG